MAALMSPQGFDVGGQGRERLRYQFIDLFGGAAGACLVLQPQGKLQGSGRLFPISIPFASASTRC